MRHNPTERIGIHETGKIISREFGWIFREQPIVDVGIDALIEQSDNGNPTGKFLAFQVKSGAKNFVVSSDKLTYYLSYIHYNYWLNFDIPVILIAYIPESDKTYWIEISKRTVKKTNKRWKLEIPKKNLLNEKAKPKLTELLTNRNNRYNTIKIFQGENVDDQTIYDLVEKSDCIKDANESIAKTVTFIEELLIKNNESNVKFAHYNNIGLNFKSPQVKASVRSYSKYINLFSKRIESEIMIFSETFGEGIFAFEQAIIMHFLITHNTRNVINSRESMVKIPSAIDSALIGVNFMKNSFLKLPDAFSDLKIAKQNMISVLDLMISEYEAAKTITTDLLFSTSELLKSNS